MVALKSLNLSELTPDVLELLARHQVITVEDFLVHDIRSLESKAQRSVVSTEFKQAVGAVLSYLEAFQNNWILGSELVEEELHVLPINCESFDELLDGGLQQGMITEIVGESSSGKTQAAASVAHQFHSGVVYVDTCNSFSATRVVNILKELRGHADDMMKGIQRIGIHDIFSMLSFLRKLHGSLQSKSETGSESAHVRLLVVDSASSLVSPLLGGSHARGHSLMICLARCLNKLAVLNKIAIMITNHTVTGDEGQMQPALGESWTSVPHVRLWLARDSTSDICSVSLIKHTHMACGKKAEFYIGASGLQSVRNNSIIRRNSSSSL